MREDDFLRSSQWKRTRRMVLERDRFTCQLRLRRCKHVATQVDHIVSWRYGGAKFDPSNLRAACAYCNNAAGQGVTSQTAPPSRNW